MFSFFRDLKAGHRLSSSLIDGNFDDSDVGKQLTLWFIERPQREEQRTLFIGVACGMGIKPEFVATRLMDCIMKSWGDEQFGDLLAKQLDEVITFDPPKDPAQAEHQQKALSLMDGLKTQLRSLDT